MYQTIKYRIYPNKEQQEFINKTFGCCRFIYNEMLRECIDSYNINKKFIHSTEKQLREKYSFLKETDYMALQRSRMDLDLSFKNRFSKTSKKQLGFPNFKSKHNSKQSYTTWTKFINNKIKLPKLKSLIKVRIHKTPEKDWIAKSATVSESLSGKYYISILFETPEIKKLPENNNSIGIDLGLKKFITTSTGETINNPKYLRDSERKLKNYQRILSRKQKGSNKRKKTKKKLAIVHEKVKNQRNDFQHKLSKRLIDENQIICIENLNVSELLKNHNLSKSIQDASWSTFIGMLIYKSKWYGRTLIQIDKYYPSSRTCNICNYKYPSDTWNLNIRKWTCPNCNTVHDRDLNAAINILKEGLKILNENTVRATGRIEILSNVLETEAL